ncbi:hypothetical protein BDF21DRAFT_80591 [Thamnidium elegans]|nr:hypothetical protein BDF21DRAFT_80591 [Thamnidium elegans]
MTKARDWMLFLPFISNYLTKVIDTIETILTTKSMYSCVNSKKTPDFWEKTILLLTNNCLDFIEFIHKKTVAQTVSEFPLDTNDIGLENGDTKRRYLGYYLLSLIYEKILANFDMQLSKVYFQEFHTKYTFQRPLETKERGNFNNQNYKPVFDIVLRCSKISSNCGFSYDRMYKVQDSLNKKDHHNISLEDRLSDDDRQMINSRMYPLSYSGIATLIAFSLYDSVLYPIIFHTSSISNFSHDLSVFEFAKKYIGILLNLLVRSNDMICQTDKGIFTILYLSDNIQTKVNMDDIQKPIQGPCGSELVFPASRIIEVISSVASTCPDASIRFLSYKLIENFLNFADDETRVFFLIELLDRCPYPTMRTAAIGLLKDQIDRCFNNKTFSIFTSPLIVKKFFPLIFKSNWRIETFWDDYSHIMQAINLYFYLLLKDEEKNLTTIWNQENINEIKKNYFVPLLNLIQKLEPDKENEFQDMQINMIKDNIDKIMNKVSK